MVIVSNGFNNFHLVMAGTEAYARNILTLYIAGAYPKKKTIERLSNSLFGHFLDIDRFKARREGIHDDLIRSKWLPEVLQIVSLKLSAYKTFKKLSAYLQTASLRWYAKQAVKDVEEGHRSGARIYHYRAGFGHQSAEVAKKLGMITLCDHSIVHPKTLQYMIDNKGALPSSNHDAAISGFWQSVLDDFNYADAILVNSEFVKATFISQGWSPERIHVAYLGVDRTFLEQVRCFERKASCTNRIRLMFAGFFGQRKGADILIKSLKSLENVQWHLDIAGGISPNLKKKYADFLYDERVNVLGILSREDLATCMQSSDIFVFPSLAEGSARVVFEALACGCYVITTPNSGSIVEDGVHGQLVEPGHPGKLMAAIESAANDMDRVHRIGADNAKLIKDNYLQSVYGNELKKIYDTLMGRRCEYPIKTSISGSN